MSSRHSPRRTRAMVRQRSVRPVLERLECRLVLSNMPQLNLTIVHRPDHPLWGTTGGSGGILPLVGGLSFPIGYAPADLAKAYGISNIKFGSIVGDGTGQTIAIVDAYDDPSFVNEYLPPSAPGGAPTLNPAFAKSDLAQFDSQLGIADPPNFTKVNQAGQTSPLPGTDPAGAGNVNGNWEIEEALDIEWAHGIAPGANIILVEATDDSNANLFAAIRTAASLPGVSAVSMSWGLNEYSGEQSLDSTFVTPAGHQGVTFVAASGDSGGFAPDAQGNPTTTPGVLYPAASPGVLGVGGTTLNLTATDTYISETAWSLSGGGTSLFEAEPTFQKGVQTTGFRTVPDVAFDADPNTGVAVYDSYNDTDNSGPWVEVGGTSLGAPAWAALIAIANQGRVLAGGTTLDGPTQTLPALYAISPTDFNDVTSGSNGVFSAGTGYDEVTGLGSPKADLVIPDLATYGTATHLGIIAQPPSAVIAGDSFGVVVAAENPAGGVDPAFSGTVKIVLGANPGQSTLGGTLTATAYHGIAVFDGLTLNNPATGYTFQITSTFPAISTNAFNVTTNPTPWQGTFYPVPTDASLRAAISAADSNSFADNTILLSASSYLLSNAAAGDILITNSSSLAGKTLTIAGQGPASSIIASSFDWTNRIFEIAGASGKAVSVVLQNLAIEGGHAENGGALGGNAALGGGLLIEGAAVTLKNVLVENNSAQGANGGSGAAGHTGAGAGGLGGDGWAANGGAIYLASGSLSLFDDTISHNTAVGGQGGQGGKGGGQGPKGAAAVTGGPGGTGGGGGLAAGGGIYAANGTVVIAGDTFTSNQAVGGPGGQGGSGGSGGRGEPSLSPPVAGKPGGAAGPGGAGGSADGGAIYLAAGSVSVTLSTFQMNDAAGGAGGQGGSGGPGTAEVVGSTGIIGGTGTFPGLTGLTGALGKGGPGGSGGPGGVGGAASGGGAFVATGALTIQSSTLAQNQATGGHGGVGGRGGTAGFGGATPFGLPIGDVAGPGATGGDGGSAYGGGINVLNGTVVLLADTQNGNVALGGHGGTGGRGGSGPIAVVFGGSGIVTGTGGTGTGVTGPGGGSALNSAGRGGDGGIGASGNGGGMYISGGTLTLVNDTVGADSAEAGSSGSGGAGGHAGTGKLTGGLGIAGAPGSSFGGGLYVDGGAVNLFNSTVALNTQTGNGSGGGVVQGGGTVTAVSTLVGGNGTVDFSGNVNATDSLFETAPTGTLLGSGNKVGVNPMLDPNGLGNNGGPTQTIALQSSSPAIGAGANPDQLLADQRGFTPRTGSNGTDIGAYQYGASADTQAPTATLQAAAVSSANASSLNPYTFTITLSDNVAIAAASLSGSSVQVNPPGQLAPIAASFVSATAVGQTDTLGDAQSFVVKYQITPPGGSWTATDNGTYTVTLGGAPVTDLAGNAVPLGAVGTFTVALSTTSATATFLKRDATTQGNWMSAYGSQGYNVIADAVSYPSYANVSVSGASTYVWSTTSTDIRALENVTGPYRTAACWYSSSSFSINVTFTDGQTHDLALYALDFDNHNRSEQIQILSAATGAVLDTESVSSFSGGVYLQWAISGSVIIKVSNVSGVNAVINGLFFGPAAANTATASFLKRDTTTQGNWMGNYGSQGYNVIADAVSYPSYANVSVSGASTYVWSTTSTDISALENVTGPYRTAACWYSSSSFSINVSFTDGQTHDLALYALDFDNHNRSEQIQILSAATGAVLDTESVSSFSGGVYLQWAISGSVVIKVSNVSGVNAVINGLFFGPGAANSATATFLKRDTTTQGNWIGNYGSKGYNVIGDAVSYPSYANVSASGASTYVWSTTSTDTSALENVTGAYRTAACWYSSSSFSINVSFTDGQTHDLALYALDFDNRNRSEQIQILSAATGAVLDTESVSSFSGGAYLQWAISGSVIIKVSNVSGPNAVVSGLFFD
jgi:hypothetical protein